MSSVARATVLTLGSIVIALGAVGGVVLYKHCAQVEWAFIKNKGGSLNYGWTLQLNVHVVKTRCTKETSEYVGVVLPPGIGTGHIDFEHRELKLSVGSFRIPLNVLVIYDAKGNNIHVRRISQQWIETAYKKSQTDLRFDLREAAMNVSE